MILTIGVGIVVFYIIAIGLTSKVEWRVLAGKQKPEQDVPNAQAGVFLYKFALQIGHEKDVADGQDSDEDSKDDTGDSPRNVATAIVSKPRS